MSELSDGERKKSFDRKHGANAARGVESGDLPGSNVNENASSLSSKMVESSQKSPAATSDQKTEKSKPAEKKFDARDKLPAKYNGIKSGPVRNRREDERRPSPSKSSYNRRPEMRSPASGSYRRDSEPKRPEPSKPFTDETRLSKLMRRIQRETERERRLIAVKQLNEYLHTAEGSKYAVKYTDDVLAVLQDMLFERDYHEVKTEVATCIGILGSLIGADAQRYFQWLFGQINSVIEDDVRALFLLALQETLRCDEKRKVLADFTRMILNNLQTLLENADTPELLISVVNVILQLTKIYPHVFSEYFRDTVDILVGWHIDSTQKDNLIEFTSEALITFKQFWVSDLYFTQDLLGQFLEDMEAYAEDLGVNAEASKADTPDEVIKITALLKVFSTVIRSLGDDFIISKSRMFTLDYVVEVFEKTVRSVECAVKCHFSEHMMFTANECVYLMLNLMKSDAVACQEYLLSYMDTQLFVSHSISYKMTLSVLKLVKKVIELFGTQLPVSTLSHILAPDSLLNYSKLSHSEEVLKELISVYHGIMGIKNVPLIEEAYRFILGDIQQCYNTLLEACCEYEIVELVNKNPFADIHYDVREAVVICIFNLCVLGEIGNSKSNVIAMWALSPSIFDLYSKYLDINQPSISVQFPTVQYAILQSMYSHCTRHGNFISTSSLLTQNTALEGSVLASVNTKNSGNFARALGLLADLLTHSHTAFDSRCLALKWVSEIVTSLQTSQHIYTTLEFMTLLQALYQAGYDQEAHIALAVQQCLVAVFKNPKTFPAYIVKGCVKLCMFHLTANSKTVCDSYFALLNLMPVNITASNNNGLYFLDEEPQLTYSEGTGGLQAMWQACRTHMGKVPQGTFHSHNFRHVMGFILNNVVPRQSGTIPWLEAMFHSSQRSGSKNELKSTDSLTMQNYLNGNASVQWFWATWEAAQFCVLSRLRTPLGKPQDTFTTIEAVLKTFASEVVPHMEGENDRKKITSSDPVYSTQLRVRLLLQFIEQLEKLLYNAYEGSGMSISSSPKAVRTFFRTNKNTCIEWLSRIRSYLITVALHCGMYTTVVRQTSEMLHDMKETSNTQGAEFESVVQQLVEALCHLGEAESVHGVYTWCRDVVGRKFTWIKATVEKAYGRYEVAAEEYKVAVKSLMNFDEDSIPKDSDDKVQKITGILTKTSLDSGDKETLVPLPVGKMNFFVNEVMDCYVQLNDWQSVLDWQEQYHQLRSEGKASFPLTPYKVDLCFIKALNYYDQGEIDRVNEQLDLLPGVTELNDWSALDKLQHSSALFLRAANIIQQHKVNNHKSELLKLLTEAESLEQSVLKLKTMDWPILMSHDTMSLEVLTTTLRSQIEDRKGKTWLLPLSERLSLDAQDHSISTFLEAIRLVQLQETFSIDKKIELSEQLLQLQISSASLARKLQNYNLAEQLILDQAELLLQAHIDNGKCAPPENIKSAVSQLHMTPEGISKYHILKIELESSKLSHSRGDNKTAVDLLSNSIVGYVSADQPMSPRPGTQAGLCKELCSRSLLTLVKWLQADHKHLSCLASKMFVTDGKVSTSAAKNLKFLLEIEESRVKNNEGLAIEGNFSELRIDENPILSDTDRIVGRLLHLSTIECDSLPKSWYTLAGWCYKWGRKAVDNASHGSVQLFTDETSQIISQLPKGTSEEETESVVRILSQIHSAMGSEEDISDQNQYDDGTDTTRRQLLGACCALTVAGDSCVEGLLDVWRGVVQRVYHYYQLSAKSYFKFLKLNGAADPLKEKNNEDCNVISTLRLLRLLVKHAWELRNVLETGLAVTPTAPWKGIIPQLFSRLSHPEAYVRQSISDLLCRVAEDAPHLIVYPAVVGSSTTKLDTKSQSETGLLNNYLAEAPDTAAEDIEVDQPSQEDEPGVEDESSSTMLHNCLTAIVDTLAANSPKMISDVKQLIEELRRITLLWDELWLGTLNQQHQDVERRISQLENEIKKVNNNSNLSKEERAAIIREKHKTVMKPTVYTIERLQEITNQPVETPHEKWFQDTYSLMIANALEKLKNPPNPNHPRASWHPFKQIHVSLQQKAQKRSSLVLSMKEISPKLGSLHNTVIAMPGLGTAGQLVTIESVSNVVQILPTKTKPKKLVFKGSDGKRYPYLFKGLEDLHLDERIMQFLNIVNNMFACADKGCHQLYRARHYSVTPLGPRSGLIQWVDGMTPLFGLYKRWQQREAVAQMLKQQGSGTSGNNNQPNLPRPSEIYYNKLTPLLKEKGIKDLENRKDWPLSVLRKVLEELMTETPKDLLSKELWCASTGPNEWWYVTQTYSRSTAVMSMIGYIIGLGDRHLDNVMVDLSTGEVVHIDYNVCFEKGKSLRVPERVPFRLTQNIETALGITGVEGTFRVASEHVMKTLRKGRETLLTLLEAFVYDPLVDWTTGNEGGYTGAFYGGGNNNKTTAIYSHQSKLQMEKEITQSMFSIRVAEMKVSWLKNRDDMLGVLPRLEKQLDLKSGHIVEYESKTLEEDRLQELKQVVIAAQNDTNSPIFSLHDRFKEYSVIKSTQDAVHKMVEEKINECSHWQQVHKHVMQRIQGSQFQQMCADIATSLNINTASFAVVTEFLQSAGQGSVITQCEQVEGEMSTNLQIQRANLHRLIDILHTYSTIVAQFGVGFAENTRSSNYLQLLQELVSDFTQDKCTEIVMRFHEMYSTPNYPTIKKQMVLSTEVKLQGIIAEVNARLLKLLERRSMEKADFSLLESQLRESRAAIDNFVKENGLAGVGGLTGVIATALCALNKRNLQMEAAAAGAGDRLMDLTSRDGDWFLDELCSMSANVSQFLDMVRIEHQGEDKDQFTVLYKGLLATHHVYVALQELNMNYRTIILPEALKIIQSGDPSGFDVIAGLSSILGETGQSLDSLITQLETLHRNAVMGIQTEDSELVTVVTMMEEHFMKIIEGKGHSSDLTSGQMLLMGFNGLFTRLDDEFSSLLETVDSLNVPNIWKKVDAVRETRSMQLSPFTSSTRKIMSCLFFVRRLQVMQEFFRMCTQFAAAVQGLDGGSCYDDEQLCKPIKRFIADYVRKQVIGFPSQVLGYILCMIMKSLGLNVTAEIELKDIGAESKVPLEDLCKKAIESCLRSGAFQQVDLTQASTLTSAQDGIWRRHDLTRRLDSGIVVLKASLQRAQLNVTRLHWLHEDMFMQEGRQNNPVVVANRATVMSEIKKCMQAVMNQETNLAACQSHYGQLEGSIIQRLRWAVGANPSLNLILQQFEDATSLRKHQGEEEAKHAQEVVSLCQGILHLEALRTRTPEALSSDNTFLALINKCKESCELTSSTSCHVTEEEEQLINIKPLEEGQRTDTAWLKSVLREINHKLKDTDKKLLALKSNIDESKDSIKGEVSTIKTLLATHHKLMSDIRAILKSLAKQEEVDYGDHLPAGGVRQYLNLYKKFSENFTVALKLVIADDFTKESLTETKSLMNALLEQIPQIYEGLMSLAPPLLTYCEELENTPVNFAAIVRKKTETHTSEDDTLRRTMILQKDLFTDTGSNSPQTGMSARPAVSTPVKKLDKVTRDPRTGKAVQERNSYAVGVWRRVKMKLDGRDPDQNKRLSVAEQKAIRSPSYDMYLIRLLGNRRSSGLLAQVLHAFGQVDYVIKDATNLDNLAVLYEGWTPWV